MIVVVKSTIDWLYETNEITAKMKVKICDKSPAVHRGLQVYPKKQ